jgi:hypothetical protein
MTHDSSKSKPGSSDRRDDDQYQVDTIFPKPRRTILDEARDRRHRAGANGEATGGAATTKPYTAAELLTAEMAATRWAVDGILPEGLTLLAGKPKLGKSWLCLGVALAVASGGRALGQLRVEPGEVLYLALEDTRRRLKSRLEKLLGTSAPPPGLYLAHAWERMDKGGGAALVEWLDDHKGCKLVVIDTWARFRPVKVRGGNDYEQDYEHAAQLKAVADGRQGLAVFCTAHCRKMPSKDPLEEVSGTFGFTGAADAVLVLRRERGKHDAALFVTGRDIDEAELALLWDKPACTWSLAGDAADYRMSEERQQVIDLLTRHRKPVKPAEAAALLGKRLGATQKLLWTMAQADQLRAADGAYMLPSGKPGKPVSPDDEEDITDDTQDPFPPDVRADD